MPRIHDVPDSEVTEILIGVHLAVDGHSLHEHVGHVRKTCEDVGIRDPGGELRERSEIKTYVDLIVEERIIPQPERGDFLGKEFRGECCSTDTEGIEEGIVFNNDFGGCGRALNNNCAAF